MKTQNTTKKITKATFKSFIRKNADMLFVNQKSSFDGMTDGIESCHGGFQRAEFGEQHSEHTLGLRGLWLVGGSRNYFDAYEDETFVGIEVCNCCGKSIVAIKKAA
jgi:hypothetical protein